MTVHVLIPVFNRLAMTKRIITQLRKQVLDESLEMIVIDDGSSDGTAEFLKTQADVFTLTGNGNLWWGGAIDLGLKTILGTENSDEGWVLFMNNDTEIREDYIQCLLDEARSHAPAAVGSVVRDYEYPHELLSVGPLIDPWRFSVMDLGLKAFAENEVVEVDALAGRGVLYPLEALRLAGGMRPGTFPHYLADYEVSTRVRKSGWRLLVACNATVFSSRDFGSTYRGKRLWDRYFSIRSPSYLPAQVLYWWGVSGIFERLTFPFRFLAFFIRRQIKKN